MKKNIINRFRLNDKKALVTGGGRGLGKAFAYALAEAGADIAIIDTLINNAEKVCEEIRAKGRKAIAIQADISSKDDIELAFDTINNEFGRLDIAVNNAGIAIPICEAGKLTIDDWQKQMDVNLKGTFLCIQAEAKCMIPQKYGKIINIASICGHIVWPDPQSLYSVSKAGVLHLTRCLAVEYIKHGIRINSISPGVTRIEGLYEEVIPMYLRTAPVDRIGKPEDLQGAVVYLASEASDFMVGQDLVIDGGYTIM
jgi:NAD(P)-dependent dehydrogenase (short-subunit alcohol dehydrogenase family)